MEEPSGEVRESAMFRSKYAKDSTETFVELDFFLSGENLSRAPESGIYGSEKRGTGQTLRKAEAQLIYPDERQPVTKAKDVTAAVEQLLGDLKFMISSTQIAMNRPKGGFFRKFTSGRELTQRGEIFRQALSYRALSAGSDET